MRSCPSVPVPRPPARAWILALALLAGGCKSVEEQRADADREAYELVARRREELGFPGAFTIEAPADSLRQRILRGEMKQSEPLRLEALLEIAAENSRDYQTQRETLFLSALDLALERWQFHWHPSVDANATVDGTGGTAENAGAGAGVGLTKVLGSGATVALDLGANLARSLTLEDGWHPVTNLGVSITQPLLRGFGERIVLEPLTQAERNLVYAVRTYERYRRTYAVDAATRYWRLLQNMNAVENQAQNYKSLQDLTQRNEALANAGRLSDIELGQARQNELRSRNDLIGARSRLATQLDDFKVFLGLPVEFELVLDKVALADLARQPAGDEIAEPLALAFAIGHRLDHQTVLDKFDDRRRKLLVAEDQLRSGLTLSASANVGSADAQPLNYDFRDTSWSTTLSWQLPIDLVPERNGYRSALIALESAARACEASQDGIASDLRDELRTMQSQRDAYQIQQSAVDLAQRRVDSARLKMDAGRADTRDLLEAEDSLLTARNAATSALIDLTLARLAVWRDLEILRVDAAGIHADESQLYEPAAGKDAGRAPAGG